MMQNPLLFSDDRVLNQTFRFFCKPGLSCFNRCCRDIYILLTPYDVLRIKNELGISSGEFLKTYTMPVPTGTLLSAVALQMRADRELECPFLTDQGCRVYAVRPWSCRLAPVDLGKDGRIRFVFESDHCLGLCENQEWTLREWMRDQGMDEYDQVEGLLRELPARVKSTGLERLDSHIRRLAYMVCYDLDRFRRYVFETAFLDLFTVDGELQRQMRDNDAALLRFGLEWLAAGPELKDTIRLRDELG